MKPPPSSLLCSLMLHRRLDVEITSTSILSAEDSEMAAYSAKACISWVKSLRTALQSDTINHLLCHKQCKSSLLLSKQWYSHECNMQSFVGNNLKQLQVFVTTAGVMGNKAVYSHSHFSCITGCYYFLLLQGKKITMLKQSDQSALLQFQKLKLISLLKTISL